MSGNVRGALWLLLAAGFFAAMHGLIKALGAGLHPFEIVFFRSLFGLLALLPFVAGTGREAVAMRRPALHLLRAALGLGSMAAGFSALTLLPLASAVSFQFTKPLFMMILAALFLGEPLRGRRSLATAAGFAGVLIMLRPGEGGWQWASLLALAGALLMALVMTTVKKMTETERPLAIVFWFSMLATLGALAPALWVWRTPGWAELGLLALMGTAGTLAQYCTVRAYRVGEASVVTPMDYAQMPFAVLIGWLAFAELPDGWTLAGAAVIAVSSLYVVRR